MRCHAIPRDSTRDASAGDDSRDDDRAHKKYTHPLASSSPSSPIEKDVDEDGFHHPRECVHARIFPRARIRSTRSIRFGRRAEDEVELATRETYPVMAEEENCAVADMSGASRRRVQTTTTRTTTTTTTTDRSTDARGPRARATARGCRSVVH